MEKNSNPYTEAIRKMIADPDAQINWVEIEEDYLSETKARTENSEELPETPVAIVSHETMSNLGYALSGVGFQSKKGNLATRQDVIEEATAAYALLTFLAEEKVQPEQFKETAEIVGIALENKLDEMGLFGTIDTVPADVHRFISEEILQHGIKQIVALQ